MWKRWILFLGASAAGLGFFLSLPSLYCDARPEGCCSLANYYRIRVGMTEEEVYTILGSKGQAEKDVWWGGDPIPTPPEAERKTLMGWCDSRHGVEIFVWFDESKKVTDKHLGFWGNTTFVDRCMVAIYGL
jgi:hypothetical protein